MANTGFVELGLIDVTGHPASEPSATVTFFHFPNERQIVRTGNLKFPPTRRFELPAFPQSLRLYCEIIPTRFRMRASDTFQLTHNETVGRNVTVFRRPDAWKARFSMWTELSDHFEPLKRVLENSPSLRVRGWKSLGNFSGQRYDQDDEDDRIILAKTSLLNLYFKLSDLSEPLANRRSWFSFVRKLLEIDRERLIAIVDPKMGEIVRKIKSDIKRFDDYKHSPAKNHFKNFPKRYSVAKSNLFSIKSDEKKSNIQLTLGPGRDEDGREVLILDADIDENGQLLRHILDVFKHKLKGGTHPYDIHEYLKLAHDQPDLGYRLA